MAHPPRHRPRRLALGAGALGGLGIGEGVVALAEFLDAEELLDAGDDVVVLLRMSGRGKESGVEVDARIAHLWTLRDGKGVRIRVLERAEALEAAGLSESAS